MEQEARAQESSNTAALESQKMSVEEIEASQKKIIEGIETLQKMIMEGIDALQQKTLQGIKAARYVETNYEACNSIVEKMTLCACTHTHTHNTHALTLLPLFYFIIPSQAVYAHTHTQTTSTSWKKNTTRPHAHTHYYHDYFTTPLSGRHSFTVTKESSDLKSPDCGFSIFFRQPGFLIYCLTGEFALLGHKFAKWR